MRVARIVLPVLLFAILIADTALAESAPPVAASTAATMCANGDRQPYWLLRTVVSQHVTSPEEFLEGAIAIGATKILRDNPRLTIRGARALLSSTSKSLRTFGIDLEDDAATSEAVSSADSLLLVAAVAAAAAQDLRDPFEDSFVRKRLTASTGRGAISYVAVKLWIQLDTYGDWASDLTRPKGLPQLWAALVSDPPQDSSALVDLATSAEYSHHAPREGLALLRLVAARADASPSAKAQAASVLARRYLLADEAQRFLDDGGAVAQNYDVNAIRIEIAEARLRSGYEEHEASAVLQSAERMLQEEAYQSYLNTDARESLELAGARAELRRLADAYHRRATDENDGPESRGLWFALASDAYRRAGDREQALAAAREGLPFVAPAVAGRNHIASGQSGQRIAAREQTVNASGFGSEPILALYRAGAASEAVSSGYLWNFYRYRYASQAGELPDVRWVVDDRSWHELELLARGFVTASSRGPARDLLSQLTADRRMARSAGVVDYEALLAMLAALTGDEVATRQHLASACKQVERFHDVDDAVSLAVQWRRAREILLRAGSRVE